MFASGKVTRGRLTPSGTRVLPGCNKRKAYIGEHVEVVVLDDKRFKLVENSLADGFNLVWTLSEIIETDVCGYGVRAADALSGTEFFARPMFDEHENVHGIRVDCLKKPWFWLEVDIVF